MSESLTLRIKRRVLERGFDAVGVARIEPLEARHRYEAWLAAGRHGDMAWLASDTHRARRANPELLLRRAKTMISVALCYVPELPGGHTERLGRIARYAAGEDYHRIMRDKLFVLEDEIAAWVPGTRALWYSDTGAILERAWAERAGIGWTGKHAGVLSRGLGSYFLLGQLILDVALEPDPPTLTEHCGRCTSCLDACPTRAIVAPYQVDARRCISYLTIEHHGPIAPELRPLIGDWVFGCDVCQEACPWNRFAPPARESRLHARALDGWTLERFLELDAGGFAALFAGSPIRRAGRAGFLRNVCIALGNRGDLAAAPALARALAIDPDALVRMHAAWALGRLGVGSEPDDPIRSSVREALERAARDDDPLVRDEAEQALTSLAPHAEAS